jgi:hypothetical protein
MVMVEWEMGAKMCADQTRSPAYIAVPTTIDILGADAPRLAIYDAMITTLLLHTGGGLYSVTDQRPSQVCPSQ